MSYNIMKIMDNGRGGKTHVLLNDGMSEILTFKKMCGALNMVKIMNENSDSGWEYEVMYNGKQITKNGNIKK